MTQQWYYIWIPRYLPAIDPSSKIISGQIKIQIFFFFVVVQSQFHIAITLITTYKVFDMIILYLIPIQITNRFPVKTS
jgi:hypothetical protein